jgi:hypothetical protein
MQFTKDGSPLVTRNHLDLEAEEDGEAQLYSDEKPQTLNCIVKV